MNLASKYVINKLWPAGRIVFFNVPKLELLPYLPGEIFSDAFGGHVDQAVLELDNFLESVDQFVEGGEDGGAPLIGEVGAQLPERGQELSLLGHVGLSTVRHEGAELDDLVQPLLHVLKVGLIDVELRSESRRIRQAIFVRYDRTHFEAGWRLAAGFWLSIVNPVINDHSRQR